MLRHSSLCTDVDQSLLNVNKSAFLMSGCHSTFEIKLKNASSESSHSRDMVQPHTLVAEQEVSIHWWRISLRDWTRWIKASVRDAHIQHLNNMLTQQQTALQAQSSGTSVTQPDLHREMLARVKEFDGDDDKWPGWWFKLQSFLVVDHIGYEALIERIAEEKEATKLTNTVLNHADKKLSSSLYDVLGLTMTDESKSLKIVRNVAVREVAIALHKLLVEYQPDIVNRHLGLLMTTMNWTIRVTDPITAINELDLRIAAYELHSCEKMADAVKRGVLLEGLAPLAEVQKHVMKDSARLNSYVQMRAEVVELLRVEAALHVPMDVDGACWSGPKGKGKMKD